MSYPMHCEVYLKVDCVELKFDGITDLDMVESWFRACDMYVVIRQEDDHVLVQFPKVRIQNDCFH